MQDMELEKEDSLLILELESLTISSPGSLRKFINLYLTKKGKKMSNYNSLKTTIDANIKQNGRQEITGQILNSVLNQMVTSLGAGYQFMGVATPDTNPGTPDQKVFYIANGKGTYANFGGLIVDKDEVVLLIYDDTWKTLLTGNAAFGYNEPFVQVIGVNATKDSTTYIQNEGYETKTFVVKKGLAYKFYMQAASDLYLRLTYSESLPSEGVGYDFIKELVPSSDFRVEYYTPNKDGYYSITYYKGDVTVSCYSFDPIIIGLEQQMTSYVTNELSTLNTYPAEYKQGSIYMGNSDYKVTNCIFNPNYFRNGGKSIIVRNTKAADGKYWKVRIILYDENKKWVRDAQNYEFKDGDTMLQFTEPYFRYAISLVSAGGEVLDCTPADYNANLIQFVGYGLRLGQLDDNIKNIGNELKEIYPTKLTKLLDFTIEKAIDVTSGYGDAVCFDGNVFQFIDGNEFCYIHDAETGTLVQTLTMPNPNKSYHNNCVTLGGKYNDSDEFPLIYAAQEEPRKCIVYRVNKIEGQYSLSVVQEILYPVNDVISLAFIDCLIDSYKGKLVMVGLKNTPWIDTDKNTLQYIVFNLPNTTTSQVQLTEDDIIFRSVEYENFPTHQGGEMRYGMLYQVFGVESPQKLLIWEMEKDRFVKEINLTEELANREPEGLYIYKDKIHIVYKGGAVYRINK